MVSPGNSPEDIKPPLTKRIYSNGKFQRYFDGYVKPGKMGGFFDGYVSLC